MRCIGSTTYEEYKNLFEKDRALSRRFQKIDVPEPSVEDTVAILQGLKASYEEHHQIQYSTEALQAAAELSSRYINYRHLPDKAIDVLDEVGARMHLDNKKRRRITAKDVEGIVAGIARIPPKTISRTERKRLNQLDRDLKRWVYGQDAPIDILSRSILRSRAGLAHPDKPVGSFLFTGPTGVGKTEVAKQLAHIMGIGFQRFDMSEYMEKHAVARLIGAPPGYVGYEQGGLLTEALVRTPHTVVLLDEIEKAHADLFNILLQVMDHGQLTDNNGKHVDFRNAVIIMTSNVGAREMSSQPIGFAQGEQAAAGSPRAAVENTFSPEFRNRLDAVIPFQGLNPASMQQIVDKFVHELQQRLAESKVKLRLSAAARAHLAEKGYDPKFGARPLQRLLQEEISDVLAEEVLFGRLQQGGRVSVGVRNQKLTFRYSE